MMSRDQLAHTREAIFGNLDYTEFTVSESRIGQYTRRDWWKHENFSHDRRFQTNVAILPHLGNNYFLWFTFQSSCEFSYGNAEMVYNYSFVTNVVITWDYWQTFLSIHRNYTQPQDTRKSEAIPGPASYIILCCFIKFFVVHSASKVINHQHLQDRYADVLKYFLQC
jgi:hypothetical protein